MKNKFLTLLTLSACLSFAQTATINGQRANFRVLVGSAAPSSGTCDAASERGSIYLRTGDQASVPSQVYVCKQSGASTYGWGPAGWVAQASAPATCVVGDLYFDTDATAGENLNLCTATNTWTTVSGGGGTGDVVGPASATDGCVALYDGPTGKLLQDSTICPDATKNGGVSMLGTTSGEFAFSVANIAGTAVTVIMPTDTSTATAGYALKTTGTVTCPTNLPTGFPSTCVGLEWGSAGSSAPPTGGVFPFFSYFYTGGNLNFTGGAANAGMWWPFVAPVAVIDEIQFKVNTAVASGKAVVIGVFAVSAGAPSGSELCYWRMTTTVESTGYKTSGAPTGGSAVSSGHCNLTLGGTYALAFSSDDTGVQFEAAGLGVGNTISRTKYSHLPGGGASVSTGSGGSLAFTSPAGWGSGFEPLADGAIMAINGSN
jgi:hypothetical protein